MPADERNEDIQAAASQRADRLVQDLAADLADLRSASPRVIGAADRQTGEQLLIDTLKVAQELATRLRTAPDSTLPSSGSASS